MEPYAQVVCERVFLGTRSLKNECIAPGQDATARHVAFESFAAAALFAAHPIHVRSATTNSRSDWPLALQVDAVASIVGRCEIMVCIPFSGLAVRRPVAEYLCCRTTRGYSAACMRIHYRFTSAAPWPGPHA